jgi:PAS domain S-box-containing protein
MIGSIRRSLRVKWMAFSVLLATIPLGIAGISLIRTYQENLRKSVIDVETEKAQLVVDGTKAFFGKVTSNLLLITKDTRYQAGGYSHIKEDFKTLLNEYDYFMELTFLDERGWEVVKISKLREEGSTERKDRSRTEMFRMASKGQIYHGDFRIIHEVIPTIVIAIPVERAPGKVAGVLVARIHLKSVWDVVTEIRIGQTGFAYVVDREGTLISHPDTRRVLLQINMRHFPMVNQVVAGKEGNMEFEHPRGEKFLYVFKPIKELEWGVVVQVPVEEAYQPIQAVTRTALIWICLSLLVAMIFSLLFTRKLIHPIKRLSGEMTKVSRGDLNVQIEKTGTDEIDLLADSFNRMVRDLREYQGALIETERKYRRVFENSKDMIYITSVGGKFIDVNQAGVEMLGHTNKRDLINIHTKDIFLHPEDRKRFQNEITQKGFVKDFEAKLKRKDGCPIDCLMTATIRKEEEGVIIGYEGIIKDISFRKNVEKELVQKTEQLQTLYDLSVLINQTLDLKEVLPIALDRATQLTRFEMGGIYLFKEGEEVLELKHYRGYPANFAEKVGTLQLGEGMAGQAALLKQAIVRSIHEYPSSQLLPFLKEIGIQSSVGIPLLAKGKAIGAITLSSRSLHHLTQREVHLLESIGMQIGLALENAILFSAVAKAKSEWETTFDAVTDLIIIRDRSYRILRANKAAFNRFGLQPGELIGNRCYELLQHRESPCEDCYISDTLRRRRPVAGERESQYLNGVFQYFTFPVFDEAGEMIAVVDLAREITEHKRFEMEKEVLNNLNKILASNLDVRKVIKTIHAELKRVLKSDRMTITLVEGQGIGFRYFALEKEEVAQELIEEEIQPENGTPFSKVMETGQPILVSDTGESDSWVDRKLFREGIRSSLIFPLEYKERIIGTINFGSREPGHFSEDHVRFLKQVSVGLAISIENAGLLDEIKASEERYRTVVEGAHDGVGVIGDDYRIGYCNERLAEISGYSRKELIGMDFRDCLDEESKQLVVDRYQRRKKGEEVPPRYEFNIRRKDEVLRRVEISSSIIRDPKGRVNTVSYVKDITEKRRMEEQLLQSEKLRALGEMASGVAHDFNNALTAILGNAQLLLYTAKDEDSKVTLRAIEKVAKDSAHTVRRLQDFTRKKAHQEFFRLDVNSIIRDTVEITKPKWKDEVQGRGFQIEMVSHFAEIPLVAGNASELREVMTNLIFNAIEAMPEGGKIEVRTYLREGKVCIQVADTGVGMAEEVRKKVFEPFFTTRPFTHTGLGLSMSYGIIKRFGGEIEVESKVRQGATFTITLPVGREGRDESLMSSLTRRAKEARILVIDDEESVRSVLSRILSQVNHQVTVAKDGGEGLQLFKEKEFDIVLTDLGMPDMSGWDVCKAIKKLRARIPVGMITGWGMELDQTKKEESGLDFVIPKPFDFHQILRVVDETMESSEKRLLS